METATKYQVRELTWPEKTFLTKRAVKSFDQLPAFFGESYGALYGSVQKSGLKATEPPFAIYYSVDEQKKETDLAAAISVQGSVPEIKGFEKVVLSPAKVITTTHYGSYESMGPAYAALEQYIAGHGLKKELMMEEYLSDPELEKDPANWKTNIYFVVK